MIEIEKNFDLKPGDKERLIQGAELLGKKTFTDVYYDSAAYDLTAKDFWLRKRDERFELKVPLNARGADRETTDQYRELETETEIARELGFTIKTDLALTLAEAGYSPFATITTKREEYRKGDFKLDFDEVTEMNYTTFEAELMVATPEEIPAAEARILELAEQHGVTDPGRGKVIEYLRKYNPDHLQCASGKRRREIVNKSKVRAR